MSELVSNRTRPLGYGDFDLARVDAIPTSKCPMRDCSATLVHLAYGKRLDRHGEPRMMPWCPDHHIRLHSGTFVYWNGDDRQGDSRLRNFIVEQDLVAEIALKLGPGAKAESHRLGYEMSEDALSWNVFVSLAVAGKLKKTGEWLTGRSLSGEPELYLWGQRIDVNKCDRGIYEPLRRVRAALENGIAHFGTEPDIMLVVKGEMVICIEAKFGSGNPLAHDGDVKQGEKPTSRAGLLETYLGASTSARTRAVVRPDNMAPRLHSQLFRNIVFASEMAEKDWHVVNLVSKTQTSAKDNERYSFADPTADVRSYLNADSQSFFTYRTWEDLYAAAIKYVPALAELGLYMRRKSAHYRPAFDLV